MAHAGLLRLSVAIGDTETDMVGVGGVAVASGMQGPGLRLVVTAALEHARTMGPQHALLFCAPLMPLYQRLGWHPLDKEVLGEQTEGRLATTPLRTMVTPLRDGVRRPPGPVRLFSLPM